MLIERRLKPQIKVKLKKINMINKEYFRIRYFLNLFSSKDPRKRKEIHDNRVSK